MGVIFLSHSILSINLNSFAGDEVLLPRALFGFEEARANNWGHRGVASPRCLAVWVLQFDYYT